MKTIGLLGGMSWESTAVYYRLINEQVRARLGGLHSARLVLYSVDFQEIETLQHQGDWQRAGEILAEAGRALAAAGADFLVLCTNTMHQVAEAIEAAGCPPLLHIADATAEEARRRGYDRLGLIGTNFTMTRPFYKDRLRQKHGIPVLIPEDAERAEIHRIIYEELCLGRIEPGSRAQYHAYAEALHRRGAAAVVLGCTEIGMLLDEQTCPIPLLDTTRIHAHAAVARALAQ